MKIEFDPQDTNVAAALGRALLEIAGEPGPTTVEHTGASPAPAEPVKTDEPEPEETVAPTEQTAKPDAKADRYGVKFDPDFCGQATDPFYGSGKREGQWKKKRGVSDEDYDAWYRSQLAAPADEPSPEEVDTAAAFSAFAAELAPEAPANAGQLMRWIAERQAAGHLTQQAIDGAYADVGQQLGMHAVTALFDPNTEAQAVAALHGALS